MQLVRPIEPAVEQKAEAPTSASHEEVPVVPPVQEDEELVDYEISLEHNNIKIIVVHYFEDYYAILAEDATHLDFGPPEAVFQNLKESNNDLKALYMRGHFNGKSAFRMPVDGGAIANLKTYSLYKKLGGTDEELIKTNITVSGIGGGDPIGAKGVASMELTVGSKTLATAFFVSRCKVTSV